MSIKDNLTFKEFNAWSKTLIKYFFAPVILIFLVTLQTGTFQIAIGAAYGTAIACAISLLGDYLKGIDPKDFPTNTTTQITSTPKTLITKTTENLPLNP